MELVLPAALFGDNPHVEVITEVMGEVLLAGVIGPSGRHLVLTVDELDTDVGAGTWIYVAAPVSMEADLTDSQVVLAALRAPTGPVMAFHSIDGRYADVRPAGPLPASWIATATRY